MSYQSNGAPPMILPSGEIMPDLLRHARSVRRRALMTFDILERQSEQEHGEGHLIRWARDNYKDYLHFLSKVMPKEPEQQPDSLSPEAMIEEFDRLAEEAKIINVSSGSPDPATAQDADPSPSSEATTPSSGKPSTTDIFDSPLISHLLSSPDQEDGSTQD